jgi:hypothetical protein
MFQPVRMAECRTGRVIVVKRRTADQDPQDVALPCRTRQNQVKAGRSGPGEKVPAARVESFTTVEMNAESLSTWRWNRVDDATPVQCSGGVSG